MDKMSPYILAIAALLSAIFITLLLLKFVPAFAAFIVSINQQAGVWLQ